MTAKLIKTEVNYILEDDNGFVIASTSLKKDGLTLSLKKCQAIEQKSLQQTEWGVEIEMENAFESFRDGTIEPLDIPKTDADGCLILKLKSE